MYYPLLSTYGHIYDIEYSNGNKFYWISFDINEGKIQPDWKKVPTKDNDIKKLDPIDRCLYF